MYQKTFPCLFVIISVSISSVYNVPARKSLELRIPGKAPIRLMDAEPSWNGEDVSAVNSEEFEHRTMRGNFRFRPNNPKSEEMSTENSAAYQTAHFPSVKLEEFLKNYANKLNKKKEPLRDLDEIKLLTKPHEEEDEEDTHFEETYGEDPAGTRQDAKQDKANKWDLIQVQKYQQPVMDTGAESNRYHSGSSDSGGANNKYGGTKIYTVNNKYHEDTSSFPHKDKDSNKQGWVTLEAVPWSISKISKWESNQQNKNKRPWHSDSYGSGSDKYTNTNKYTSTKPWLSSSHAGYYGSGDTVPWEHYTSTVAYRPEKPSYKPVADYRPHSSYFRPGFDKDDDVYHAGSGPRPSLADYDQNLYNRPIISSSSYQDLSPSSFSERPSSYSERPSSYSERPSSYSERPWSRPKPAAIGNDYGRPYWNKLSQLHHNHQFHSDGSECEHNRYKSQLGDIITDGLPGNFPKEGPNRRRGVEPEEQQDKLQQDQQLQASQEKVQEHPETHPANGNGEWVLLSTTKGYQRPVERQRSIKIVPAKRQVRLTVLPPEKDSKVNMTTSHGGMLEVESTFQTVEQDQKRYARQQKFNATQIAHLIATTTSIHASPNKVGTQKPTQVQKIRNTNGLDSTAVVAAVGAGMIPAAAIGAMLVPMAMGRKKRSLFETTHHPLEEYQVTLPRSL